MIKSFHTIYRLSVNYVESCLLEQLFNPVASANLLLNYLCFQGLGQSIFRSSTNCHPFGFTILSQTFKATVFCISFIRSGCFKIQPSLQRVHATGWTIQKQHFCCRRKTVRRAYAAKMVTPKNLISWTSCGCIEPQGEFCVNRGFWFVFAGTKMNEYAKQRPLQPELHFGTIEVT